MTSINTNFKASVTDTSGDYSIPSSAESMEAAQSEIQDILYEMENFEFLEYLTEEQLAEFHRIKTMLKAESAAIAGYGLSGSMDALGASGSSYWDAPTELQPEWNGIPPEFIHTDDAYGQSLIDDPDVEFVATVVIPNNGDVLDPTKVGFQMTDDMVALYGESKGRDMVITAEYQDGSKRAWVLKEGTVRREPLIISANGLSHGVNIDFTRVVRVSDGSFPNYPYGARSGCYFWGTEYDDVIKGTMSDDAVMGLGGDDNIWGNAGNDTIFGDYPTQKSGESSIEGGNDVVNGGAGFDLIYGGGGEDSAFASDQVEGDLINEHENLVDDVLTEPPDPADWFVGSGSWEVQEEMQDGMMVVENVSPTGIGGDIGIMMPDGFSNVFAEQDDSQNLILTFVGESGTFKVKIMDFFSEQWGDVDGSISSKIVNLEFIDSSDDDIIDFSRVELTSQAIKINGANGGDDIILNARYKMLSDGLDPYDLFSSQGNSDGSLGTYVSEGIFSSGSEGEYDATVQNGQIVISEVEGGDDYDWMEIVPIDEDYDGENPSDEFAKLGLVAPPGYETGYITYDDAGNIYVTLVNSGVTGDAESIVFKIEADTVSSLGLNYNNIAVFTTLGDGTTSTSPIALTALSSDPYDYEIDGGAGNDFILTQKGGVFAGDGNDYVAEGDFDWDDINAYSDLGSYTSETVETEAADEVEETEEGEDEGDEESSSTEE